MSTTYTRQQPDLQAVEALHATTLMSVVSPRWEECDGLHHVHHSRVLSWMEEARITIWQRLGLDPNDFLHGPYVPLVKRCTLDYQLPIPFGAQVAIHTRVTDVTRIGVRFHHGLVHLVSGIKYVHGDTLLIWVDRASGRLARLDESHPYTQAFRRLLVPEWTTEPTAPPPPGESAEEVAWWLR